MWFPETVFVTHPSSGFYQDQALRVFIISCENQGTGGIKTILLHARTKQIKPVLAGDCSKSNGNQPSMLHKVWWYHADRKDHSRPFSPAYKGPIPLSIMVTPSFILSNCCIPHCGHGKVRPTLGKTKLMLSPVAPLCLSDRLKQMLHCRLFFHFSTSKNASGRYLKNWLHSIYKVTPVFFNTKHIFGYRQKRCLIVANGSVYNNSVYFTYMLFILKSSHNKRLKTY